MRRTGCRGTVLGRSAVSTHTASGRFKPPARDTRKSDNAEDRERDDIEEGRRIRKAHEDDDRDPGTV
ncbi:hypothetical protein K0817_012885 [Microbacterium sp. HD4P20]|uniref:hypothetical protein n=1 Tax=Microbacterium sp. HD4P20 TaxID=2864874 RepID=UPI001C641DC8|nr:hypothetical protein [Microbacterium sp. HD4P20]MCP2637451.1 hypothetical protein [Microbacterium sp. HD4P20]